MADNEWDKYSKEQLWNEMAKTKRDMKDLFETASRMNESGISLENKCDKQAEDFANFQQEAFIAHEKEIREKVAESMRNWDPVSLIDENDPEVVKLRFAINNRVNKEGSSDGKIQERILRLSKAIAKVQNKKVEFDQKKAEYKRLYIYMNLLAQVCELDKKNSFNKELQRQQMEQLKMREILTKEEFKMQRESIKQNGYHQTLLPYTKVSQNQLTIPSYPHPPQTLPQPTQQSYPSSHKTEVREVSLENLDDFLDDEDL